MNWLWFLPVLAVVAVAGCTGIDFPLNETETPSSNDTLSLLTQYCNASGMGWCGCAFQEESLPVLQNASCSVVGAQTFSYEPCGRCEGASCIPERPLVAFFVSDTLEAKYTIDLWTSPNQAAGVCYNEGQCEQDEDCLFAGKGNYCSGGTCIIASEETCPDLDGDSFGTGLCPGAQDCDDSDPSTHPGAEEVQDGKDNDCDGVVDDPSFCVSDSDCVREPSCCPHCGGAPYINKKFAEPVSCEGILCIQCAEPATEGRCIGGRCTGILEQDLFACKNDSDCAIESVGNCCGRRAVNTDFSRGIQQACAAVCPDYAAQCRENRCVAVPA